MLRNKTRWFLLVLAGMGVLASTSMAQGPDGIVPNGDMPIRVGGQFGAHVSGVLNGSPVRGNIDITRTDGWGVKVDGWNADMCDGYSIGEYIHAPGSPVTPTGYIPLVKGSRTFKVLVIEEN